MKTKRQLQKWVTVGCSYARSLPEKGSGHAARTSRAKRPPARTHGSRRPDRERDRADRRPPVPAGPERMHTRYHDGGGHPGRRHAPARWVAPVRGTGPRTPTLGPQAFGPRRLGHAGRSSAWPTPLSATSRSTCSPPSARSPCCSWWTSRAAPRRGSPATWRSSWSGCGFIALGTLVSTHKVAAVAAMAVVGFVVLFAGIVAPQAATAATAALLLFVLPVAVAAPRLADRAAAARLGRWPPPSASRPACSSGRPRGTTTCAPGSPRPLRRWPGWRTPTPPASPIGTPTRHLAAELGLLPRANSGPRPTRRPAPPSNAVALAKLVGRVEWVAEQRHVSGDHGPGPRAVGAEPCSPRRRGRPCAGAALICDGTRHPVDDPEADRGPAGVIGGWTELDALIRDAELSDADDFEDPSTEEPSRRARDGAGRRFRLELDPGFHARALGIATEMVSDATLAAAGRQTVVDKRLGMGESDIAHFVARTASPTSRSTRCGSATRCGEPPAWPWRWRSSRSPTSRTASGWCWARCRCCGSNALGTGATALRAVGGTAVGFVDRLGHHDRRLRSHGPAVGPAARCAVLIVGRGAVDDLVRRRPGRRSPWW